jgi:NADPH-dependent curcumin reductase CurA
MISGYNSKPYPVMVSTKSNCPGPQFIVRLFCIHQNLMNIVTKGIKVYGFIVASILPKYKDTFYAEVPARIASGELKLKEDLAKGLESVGEAILAVLKGTNTGKSVIVVADQ